MSFIKKKQVFIPLLLLLVVFSFRYVNGAYLTNNRDTKPAPDKVTYDLVVLDDYELLYESDTFEYYFREDRDVIAIKDKKTGYTWKTGLDIPFARKFEDELMLLESKEERKEIGLANPLENRMSDTNAGIANSLVSVEMLQGNTIKNFSSAAKDGAESTLYTLNDNKATRRLDVNFISIDLKISLYITFHDNKITYDIKHSEIKGKGLETLLAIKISPFLGASGGSVKYYNEELDGYDTENAVRKYQIPGYVFVPDGSGSLIRFADNNAAFMPYMGSVYGKDPAQDRVFDTFLTDVVPLKQPVMPVFGIAHGNLQAAFVAYAEKGAEFLEITVMPEEQINDYTFAYPRFVVNSEYWQIFNKRGEGFFTLMKEPNNMDITMTYEFLSGDGSDGSPKADYTGMAQAYRKHLIETGVLTEKQSEFSSIPLRLDFIMSDSKKGIVGTDEVVVTTVEDVDQILDSIREELKITNINAGLYGWQKKGETFSKVDSKKYSRAVGTKRKFIQLIESQLEKGIDISYARDYSTINKKATSYYQTATRHVSSHYIDINKFDILPDNTPIGNFSIATPKKTASWFLKNSKAFSKYANSITAGGISNVLTSNYNSDGVETTSTEAIAMYEDAMKQTKELGLKVNLEAPNMYLWKYTDRYLSSPVGTSQYVFETDAVPFLQMVLHGTMESYAPYSNFSFYTQSDILKIIDYNLFPSFIVSEQPSYPLSSTVSSHLYSTEFSQYKDTIGNVYNQVNEVLSSVNGYSWSGREVLEDGVILNTYTLGNSTKYILINYTDETVTFKNFSVPALKAMVLE